MDSNDTGCPALNILNKHLIPDLAKMVLKYCWAEKSDLYGWCYYGNFEKVLAENNTNYNLMVVARTLARNGYEKIYKLLVLRARENHKDIDWEMEEITKEFFKTEQNA